MIPEHDVEDHEGPDAGERPPTNGSTVRINGAVHHGGSDAVVEPIAGLEDVAWRSSYDRADVDRYLAEVEAEKGRLLAEIRVAEEREAAAQGRCQERAEERDDLLGSLLLAARAEIDLVDDEHRAAVAAIRAEAEEEAAGIRDRAQIEATAVREAVASLTAITSAGEPMREAVASLTALTGEGEPTGDALTDPADDAAADAGALDQGHVG
jgi:hypothetical protein